MLSKQLDQLTHRHFGVHLRITAFWKFVSFWLKQHVCPALKKNSHVVIDKMASYSEQTAARHCDQESGLGTGVSTNNVHHMLLVCPELQRFIGHEPLALSIYSATIDEQGPLMDHYRALAAHFDIPDHDTPLTITSIPTTSPTINVLWGGYSNAIHNELVTIVALTICEEMIVQLAILHPTLPPVHTFHELWDVSNVYVHPHQRTILSPIKATLLAPTQTVVGLTQGTKLLLDHILATESSPIVIYFYPGLRPALLWTLRAYCVLLAPWSAFSLNVVDMGASAARGFSM
ncbi:hypothetical protein B0H17DRAFT_1153702 [Mycena rosella]|uniref:Uncharacterized protein n=1 Tax=Mycena rosella TaxID=1033263 RepID=A0AAD7B3R4_MYCRO|nr:hypothetical protein B0H17DRAFT_1153702 [Mycena rosella]